MKFVFLVFKNKSKAIICLIISRGGLDRFSLSLHFSFQVIDFLKECKLLLKICLCLCA